LTKPQNDLRLIEAGFPCHQVGAQTQRERDTGKAPPTHRLHVWWARRPLTPSRAAILASLLPADTDPDFFLRELGIEKVEAMVGDVPWVLVGSVAEKVEAADDGAELLIVDAAVHRALLKEQERRAVNRRTINKLCQTDTSLANHPVVVRWLEESKAFNEPLPHMGTRLEVGRVAADPAHVNGRIEFAKSSEVKRILGGELRWSAEDLYGYGRAYSHAPTVSPKSLTILDPTAGGGSIPFEALRLGHNVIANDLNPVASVILHATLQYPFQFGLELAEEISRWGQGLVTTVAERMQDVTPFSPLPTEELLALRAHCKRCPEVIPLFNGPEHDQVGLIYVRQVTCPHCGGEAPLLNTCWLSKGSDPWGVRVVTDGRPQNGKVWFEPYRVKRGKGPNGEDPNLATVTRGVGSCVHCHQAISAEEIKAQACGESQYGTWRDRLYTVVAIRFQPKLDKIGKPQRYKTGEKAGQIKTEKVRFFRAPNQADLDALTKAQQTLADKWDEWERQGLIPTENIPKGHKTLEPLRAGMKRWCDMFTPRQLLGHLTLVEELNRIKPLILEELGEQRGRAVVTYLQFMIDKGVDYNSKQTRWEYTRGIVKGTFGRHDFSLKWTFGEMVFAGPNSGAAWALSQVFDAYKGMSQLASERQSSVARTSPNVRILHGTAAKLDTPDQSVDLVCMDPPYYNNVQYAELSDYFYVWQRRTLADLYPEIFTRLSTNKLDEAVANPARDGSTKKATKEYERLMGEIFAECARVLRKDGLMTLMFTHKTTEAWEALTRSLVENGWIITASLPVESEAAESTHQKNMASAASSVFLACRKREGANSQPSSWTGFGGSGVAQKIRDAVQEGLKDFTRLRLNPVDEMVACYGRALRVLSENWPVLDGDEQVSPIRAMNEASAVVAQHQISRLTEGRILVNDLSPEAAMALTLFGIFGLNQFSYDSALNLSRSLNIRLDDKPVIHNPGGRSIGINAEVRSGRSIRRLSREDVVEGYHAPLVKKGSKLRLAMPDERVNARLERPQSEWDILHGLITSYRAGDVPVARAYLSQHAEGRQQVIVDLLNVWKNQVDTEELRKEAEAMLFGLK
jgi:putative DNA methylase